MLSTRERNLTCLAMERIPLTGSVSIMTLLRGAMTTSIAIEMKAMLNVKMGNIEDL